MLEAATINAPNEAETTNAYNEAVPEYSIPSGLSHEQAHALKHLITGHNIFFTGAAGTGKSFLLKEVIRYLQTMNKNHLIAASTGISALHIGGVTLHSAIGIGFANDTFENILHSMKREKKTMLRKLDCLILDEISMISDTLFNCIDYIFRAVRRRDEPFGGIQMIVSGDFFQLAPVITKSTCPDCGLSGPVVSDNQTEDFIADSCWELIYPFHRSSYAFNSSAWAKGNFKMFDLVTNFRQESGAFQNVLNSIRYGEITPQVTNLLRRCSRPLDKSIFGSIAVTHLYPTREKVSNHNFYEFNLLPGECHTFNRSTEFQYDINAIVYANQQTAYKKYVEKSCGIEKEVQLKEDSQVVLLTNKTKDLVNGSRGVVIGFEEWSILHLQGLKKEDQKRIANYLSENDIRYVPIVLFRNGQQMVVLPNIWTMQVSSQLQVLVIQMPLSLAWALTTHKSQGMTLDCLKVDFDQTWRNAAGLIYVGLSRVKSEDGLEIKGFRDDMVCVDPKVKEFYQKMSSCD
ncbi:ATP-dependent DNA helicase PIF1 [Neolecta irregularis DAH-3]|uniref:ATP-dependent DNA helicase n=1 Tax=Neolecta irregularis (strain DAH-3) TaxID=1198029 RepID=A0A1U7LTM0_NEOID|nr:ATP-dependent DNA helicase PIF1 [Neolecta irregularis DAH-3]|eukprot:OLL25892.1 ATP-dependent DNA helicase PIF1 [Neolecta irregularis DAH-3]